MSEKSEKPRIEDLPRLEIVPTTPQPQTPEPDIKRTILPEDISRVWAWRKPTNRSKNQPN